MSGRRRIWDSKDVGAVFFQGRWRAAVWSNILLIHVCSLRVIHSWKHTRSPASSRGSILVWNITWSSEILEKFLFKFAAPWRVAVWFVFHNDCASFQGRQPSRCTSFVCLRFSLRTQPSKDLLTSAFPKAKWDDLCYLWQSPWIWS